jgi:hypothetical protein
MPPPWFASMMQAPAATNVAVVLETVQILVVVEVKVTARPEVAVAESVSGVPTVWVAISLKMMLCAIGTALTVKLCETMAAAK